MKYAVALCFKEHVTSDTTGHRTRSTSGAMRFEVRCGEIRDVVLKPMNNEFGGKLLANELICAELARRLGLPVPESMVVEIPPWLPPVRLRLHPERMLAVGPSFGVAYIDQSVSPPDTHHIELADNLVDLAGIIAFDTWIGNQDRTTPGNLLARPRTDRPDRFYIWMIDHGHAFSGPDWTSDSLPSVPYLPARYPPLLLPSLRAGASSRGCGESQTCRND